MKLQCEECLSKDVDSFKAFADERGAGFVCPDNHFNYLKREQIKFTDPISHWIDVEYTDNEKLQRIICDLLKSATSSLMDDGHIHRKKFLQSAKKDIEELERLLK